MKTNENTLTISNNINENCFWELNLYTGKLSWSDGICQLLGLNQPYTPTLEQLFRYQSEKNLRPAFNRAIHQGIPFELELSALLPFDKVMVVYTTANPVYDDYGKCIAIKGTLQSEAQDEKTAQLLPFIPENVDEQHIMLENFARIISHNLRSHTSNLQMVLESIDRNTSTKQIRVLIGDIKTISSNLNQTVCYLNTLTKI